MYTYIYIVHICVDIYTHCVYTHTHSAVFGFPLYIFTKRTAKKLHKDGVFGVQIVAYIAMYFYKHGGKFSL